MDAERGNGLVSTKVYSKDEIIRTLDGQKLDKPCRESIRVVVDESVSHIVDEYGKFINHSFNPTCYIDKNNLVALDNIPAGTELTFNYNENEVDMAAPFTCDGVLVTGKKIDNWTVN